MSGWDDKTNGDFRQTHTETETERETEIRRDAGSEIILMRQKHYKAEL